MGYCPSQDWDANIQAEDDAIATEVAWWQNNKERVLDVAKVILGRLPDPMTAKPREVVDLAAEIVRLAMINAESPY